MDDIIKVDTVSQYNALFGAETLHPLISIIDFSKSQPVRPVRMNIGLYCIFLKDIKCGNLTYGCSNYDYEEGTLVFVGPGQILGVENDGQYIQPKGYALIFHPDMIYGTALNQHIKDYTFFSYDTKEALHLSKRERAIITDCFDNINFELEHSVDTHSKTLIVSYIELLLNYCTRFYDRQFITREVANNGILERFENVLDEYFQSEAPQTTGLPSVSFFADKLNLSANYFGDLIKKETGKSASEYIHLKLMNLAKGRILDTTKTVSEIAYELGFKYPQHFSRMFKKSTGYSPNEYRTAVKSIKN
ncbi:MAG: AraC family transcriptional regulator [Bacteroidales bacterium]|nr:AraC family transcriptional regulator [Bacteroidales bacterium]MCI1785299.1 AraC family transcriptional regulator [Bacteroidales bacterium]